MNETLPYATIPDIPYHAGGHPDAYANERCRLDVHYPADTEDYPTVVWFHGGGLNSGERSIPEGLKGRGFAVVPVDYRLSPRAKAPAYIEDAGAALAWVFRHIAAYGGNPEKVIAAGASAGAYLAAMITLDPRWLAVHGVEANRVRALVSLTGQMITHFTVREERGISPLCALVDPLAPLYHVRGDAPPMLLVTGDRDLELFGRYEENAYFQRMMKLAGHRQVELVELKGLDHGGVETPAIPHAVRFIRSVTGTSD